MQTIGFQEFHPGSRQCMMLPLGRQAELKKNNFARFREWGGTGKNWSGTRLARYRAYFTVKAVRLWTRQIATETWNPHSLCPRFEPRVKLIMLYFQKYAEAKLHLLTAAQSRHSNQHPTTTCTPLPIPRLVTPEAYCPLPHIPYPCDPVALRWLHT